jgi:hypothetical protein
MVRCLPPPPQVECVRGFYVDTTGNRYPKQYLKWVRAETPLEAVAKLGRHGYLSGPFPKVVYVVLSFDEHDRPKDIVGIQLAEDAVKPAPKQQLLHD